MILRQTGALFLDAYRELNARKLFWFVLALSGLGVAAFAAVGIDEKGVRILWFPSIESDVLNTRFIGADVYYKFLFATVGVSVWLSWIAGILALVSTASIFPDFVAGGSIELLLSKPIARARLFVTKYLTGLLFTVVQVTVFSLACFLVIGFRGNSWTPQVFWAVPFVTVTFSYLFCVCALLGLLTRSTIASLLLTLLFWLAIFGVDATEKILLQVREGHAVDVARAEKQLETALARAASDDATSGADAPEAPGAAAPEQPATEDADPDPDEDADAEAQSPPAGADAEPRAVADARKKLDEANDSFTTFRDWHGYFYWAKTFLPKTAETEQLLKRRLLDDAQLAFFMNAGQDDQRREQSTRGMPRRVRERVEREQTAARNAQKELDSRSAAWVMGTSLGFEAVVLAVGAVLFRRRDF